MKSLFPLLTLLLLAGSVLPGCSESKKKEEMSLIESGLADLENENYDEAVEKFKKAEQEMPNEAPVANLVGAAYTKQKNYPAAKAAFEKSIKLDPNFFPAHFNLGELLFLQEQYPQALGYFTNMLRGAPGNELIQFKVVLCLLMTDQTEDAEKLISRMKFPGDGPAWYYAQSALAHKKGDAGKASDYLKSAQTFFSGKLDLYNETFEDLGWPTK